MKHATGEVKVSEAQLWAARALDGGGISAAGHGGCGFPEGDAAERGGASQGLSLTLPGHHPGQGACRVTGKTGHQEGLVGSL